VSGRVNTPQKVVEKFYEFSLLGMLASGYFALLGSGYLDWPSAAILFAALSLRGLMSAELLTLVLPGRVLAASLLLCAGFFPLDYLYLSGTAVRAVAHLAFFLATIKILTAKTARDFTLLKVIAAAELLGAAMLSADLSFFAFLALFLLFTIATFSSGEVVRATRLFVDTGRRSVARGGLQFFRRRLSVVTFGLFAGILSLTAGMFFVLPRTARAALQRFAPQRYHIPGFANEVKLGEIGEIKLRGTPVMHIRAYDGGRFLAVRWRGAALAKFDGTRWFNPPAREERLWVDRGLLTLAEQPHTRSGRDISYQVQLNEIASDTLFFAGTPETISIDVPMLWRSPAGSLRAPRANGGLRYGAYSYVEDESGKVLAAAPPLPETQRRELLELPSLDERIPQLARDMTANAVTQEDKARALQDRLRHDYGYTLELLPATVSDPLANFLFVRKKGHCEYFASAMAVMLRTLGVPSRVATGFLSGEYNPMTGWQVVRASDAHSWVEAWFPGRGWTTFDPTPSDPNGASTGLWSRAGLFFDAVDQFWQNWVVGYDVNRQIVLATRMQESSRQMRFGWIDDAAAWFESGARTGRVYLMEILILLVLGVGAILYGPAAARRWRAHLRLRRAQRGDAPASDATVLYERMLHLLERRGFQKPPWLTPAEFARVLPASEVAVLVEDLTAAYNEVRFGGRRDAAPRMIWLLQRLEASRK
jgi:transglutaminase-like putative cysteine protease